MWTNTAFLKFDSEEDWKNAAAMVGILETSIDEESGEHVESWNYYTQDWAVDVIGTIYDPGTYDEEGKELTPPVPHEGWHVNAKWNTVRSTMPTFLTTRGVMPVTPRRIFYGDDLEAIRAAAVAAAAGASDGY